MNTPTSGQDSQRGAFGRNRAYKFENLSSGDPLDVLIVGGGISGAPLYRELCRRGYRTGLVDKGDFASGTSQASGMLIWGGLLYLQNFDLLTVSKLCKARKELMAAFPERISALDLRYLTSPKDGPKPGTVLLGLYAYWLLGGFALRRPTAGKTAPGGQTWALGYQEGMLRESDSRFVIDLIRPFDSEHCIPLNYCRLTGAEFDPTQRIWTVALRDESTGAEHRANARVVVNGAGVWTDFVNRLLDLDSPYKHVFSKGVYLAFPWDEEQTEAHIYPMRGVDDVLTHVPWGPVTMWGPTETAIQDLESGLHPNRDDIRFLLTNANDSLPHTVGPEDIVSVRCGVRSLVVPRNYTLRAYPLTLSRRHRVVIDKGRQAIAFYGGKFTSSLCVAAHVAHQIGRWISPRFIPPVEGCEPPEMLHHPTLRHNFVTSEWARDHEFCMTLEDYLRRRTQIAQWTPRMGLGRDGLERSSLNKLAEVFASNPAEADAMVEAYEQRVCSMYDPLLEV
ncbi:MAG: FAD-dependent oxidoreductase [Chthoniobacteraceae bacterium]